MNSLEKALEFLNLDISTIKVPEDLLLKLSTAAEEDDFFKVHLLGYDVLKLQKL